MRAGDFAMRGAAMVLLLVAVPLKAACPPALKAGEITSSLMNHWEATIGEHCSADEAVPADADCVQWRRLAGKLQRQRKKMQKEAVVKPFAFVLGGDPSRQKQATSVLASALFVSDSATAHSEVDGAVHLRPSDSACQSADGLLIAVRKQLELCGLDSVIVLHEVDQMLHHCSAALRGLVPWLKGDKGFDEDIQRLARTAPVSAGPPVLVVLAGKHGGPGELSKQLKATDMTDLWRSLDIESHFISLAEEDIGAEIETSLQSILSPNPLSIKSGSDFADQIAALGFVGQTWYVLYLKPPLPSSNLDPTMLQRH
eukprot:SAG31_NODE_3061_length_4730_cov_16.996330_2_plen_313_part_00